MQKTGEDAHLFSRNDLEAILLSDNAGVRSRFQQHFADLIQQFLDESERACRHVLSFGRGLKPDLRAAWTEAFVFSAFNSSLTSCHLLISGFPIPSGNLMRHYGEAFAMALLLSHHAIDVAQRFDRAPTKFPVHNAVQLVRKRRNTEFLRIDAQGWRSFEAIAKWYDDYSHASALSLATQTMLGKPGGRILGGEFDDYKLAAYRKELGLRVSSMARLCDLIAAVETNLKVSQTKGFIEPKTPAV
jgi:hypothetical protein